MRSSLCTMLVVGSILPATLSAQTPIIDYHQHLFSPDAAALVTGDPGSPGIGARHVITLLDSAGIRRALVLSVAYTWGKASRATVDDEYNHVKAENDWTAQQVVPYSDRLRAFCSFNPLRPYAIDELVRCTNIPQLRDGLKLHFGNSDVDLDNPENVAQVRRIFEAANRRRMAIVVHMRTSLDLGRRYGADAAGVFLNELLPAAPDVPVQIAHLAGAGGYDAATDSALSVFTDAIARHDPRMNNVWFDATAVVRAGMSAAELQQITARIRQLGVERMLYGSDANPLAYPQAGWEAFQRLPLHRLRATHQNHVWSYDLVMDQTEDGRRLKMLPLLDGYTRVSHAILVDRSITAEDVVELLAEQFSIHGEPGVHSLRQRPGVHCKRGEGVAGEKRCQDIVHRTGSPWENAYSESFNSRFRDELLNRELFCGVTEARVLVEEYRLDYNHRRPHSALGYMTPAEFASRQPAGPINVASAPDGATAFDHSHIGELDNNITMVAGLS